MKRNLLGLSLIICVIAALSCIGLCFPHNIAVAENIDVQVSLTDESLLASFGDIFVYTNDKTICLAKDNKVLSLTEKSDFDSFVDISVNSTHILALAKKDAKKYLWVYEYNDRRIAKTSYTYSEDENIMNSLVGLYADEDGNFFTIDTIKVNAVILNSTEKKPSYFISNDGGVYNNVTDFIVVSDTLYCIIDNDLYAINKPEFYSSDWSNFFKLSGDFIGLSAIGNDILLLSADGIYKYQPSNSSITTILSEGLNVNSKISSAIDTNTNRKFVYAKSSLNAVNMYEYVNDSLEYYGCFDNTVYVHPSEYNLIKLYKTVADVTIYSSPRHLQRMGTAPKDSYLIALNQIDDFIYVYYRSDSENKTIYGYIKNTASITLCPADNGALGEYAQPLHENTPIYKYPFNGSEKLTDGSIYMQLIVIDNVGQDGNFSWGWYKVGYVDEEGNVQYGYVKQQNLSPYTQLSAPSLSKSVKLTSKKLGHYITLYALPFEDEANAIEVTQLAEGTSVYLKEKYNKKSQWTAVYYEGKTAYVRTQNVNPSGLTTWQLTLAITVPCVVVAIAITVTILLVARKKKLAYKS